MICCALCTLGKQAGREDKGDGGRDEEREAGGGVEDKMEERREKGSEGESNLLLTW